MPKSKRHFEPLEVVGLHIRLLKKRPEMVLNGDVWREADGLMICLEGEINRVALEPVGRVMKLR